MLLQQFLFKRVRMRGQMGTFEEERMTPVGQGPININGRSFEPDEHGWVEIVPFDVAMELKSHVFHQENGGVIRYCTPDEVDEVMRLGLMDRGASAAQLPQAPAAPALQSPPAKVEAKKEPAKAKNEQKAAPPAPPAGPEAEAGGRPSTPEEIAAAEAEANKA